MKLSSRFDLLSLPTLEQNSNKKFKKKPNTFWKTQNKHGEAKVSSLNRTQIDENDLLNKIN